VSKPEINVTPLIDVLLVLLIIFMVVAPLKPSRFKARVPAEPPNEAAREHPDSLVVSIGRDFSLSLNREAALGTVNETQLLMDRLQGVLARRTANGAEPRPSTSDPERPFADNAERTVFIKAPRDLPYGSIIKVVDAVKLAGAYPIALQIDML
jgi:biopolymer transport protein ExbD